MTYRKGRPSEERVMPFNERPDLITDPVFLIGNGTSRKHFDLERLRGKGTIIGCNALYREFAPDLLITIDAKMLREVKESGYAENHTVMIPRGRTVAVPKALTWRTERFNTSGCFGIKMIKQLINPKFCYMLGMDGFPGNVYDKTKNYAENTLQNFQGVMTYYIKALAEPGKTMFVNVNVKNAWPEEATATGNYSFITYEEFEALYSNWQRERA